MYVNFLFGLLGKFNALLQLVCDMKFLSLNGIWTGVSSSIAFTLRVLYVGG